MRKSLLSSTAIGLVLAVNFAIGPDAEAACVGAADGGDNDIVCSPPVADGADLDALGGNDNVTLLTGDGTDLIIGDTAATTLFGNAGDDRFLGQIATGVDSIVLGNQAGGSGTLTGGSGNDLVDAEVMILGNETGATGVVLGDDGADTLELTDFSYLGRQGTGTLSGGGGDDRIVFSSFSLIGGYAGASGSILGDDGSDVVFLADGSAVGVYGTGLVSGGAANDTLTLTSGVSVGALGGGSGTVAGDGGDDVILVDNGVRLGYYGNGTITGGDGNDSIEIDTASQVGAQAGSSGVILGDSGNDIIELRDASYLGLLGSATLSGGSGNDTIDVDNGARIGRSPGGSGTILGDGGDDLIALDANGDLGYAGSGTILGGLGDDTIGFAQDSDLGALAAGTGVVLAGSGSDRISFAGNSDVADRGSGTVDAGSGNDLIAMDGSAIGEETGSDGTLAGGAGADSLGLTDSAVGLAGQGLLAGGGGNDLIALDGGSAVGDSLTGSGTISGDDGSDSIVVRDARVGVTGAATILGGAGSDTLQLEAAAALGGNGRLDGGVGDDRLRLEGGVSLTAGSQLDGGADDDTLELFGDDGVAMFTADPMLLDIENLDKTGAGAWWWEQSVAFAGSGDFRAGVFRVAEMVDLGFAGGATVQALATLEGNGTISANLLNLGLITPGNDSTDFDTVGTLTIDGDYDGGGGAMLRLDVTLGVGGDILAVTGATSGSTAVSVNLQGDDGSGLETLVIDVGGASGEADFFLAEDIVSQGFVWALAQNDEGDWVLRRSIPEPISPANALVGSAVLNVWHAGAGPLHERLAELRALLGDARPQTASLGADDSQFAVRASTARQPTGLWLRVVGESFDHDASVGIAFDQETAILQFGWDLGLRNALFEGDLLTAGLFAGVVGSKADATGLEVSLEGYSVGTYGTLLWQDLHLDLVVKADFLEVTRSESDPAFVAEYDAWSVGGALEAGWRLDVGERYFVAPSAKLTYVAAFVDDSPTSGGSTLVAKDSHSLKGRLALRAGASLSIGEGRLLPYAEIGVQHEFLGESEALVGLDSASSDLGGTALEIGVGLVAIDIADHMQLTVDADYLTGGTGDGFQVTGGLRFSW